MRHEPNIQTCPSILDRPVWFALLTRQQHLAWSHASARMLDPDFGPFAASEGLRPGQIADFSTLIAASDRQVITLEAERFSVTQHLSPNLERGGVQMVADRVDRQPTDRCFEVLGEDDAPDMFRLAQDTQPGPFATRTHELGTFIGLRREGRLVAIAGQRMKLPGYTEISAVCVDPAHRGQGLGAALVQEMSRMIVDAGDTPFLHAYTDNDGAIALYEGLGFRMRTRMRVGCYRPHDVKATT